MNQTKRDRVIILRTIKHGEANMIIHAINTSGARINLIAKGAFRSRKRFAGGVLEPTHYIQITYHQSRNKAEDSLHVLLEASLLDGFSGLRQDYSRLETAFYFLQVTGKICQEGVIDSKENFDLLGHALKACETSPNLNYLRTLFEMKILLHQGVLPQDLPMLEWLHFPIVRHADYTVDESNFSGLRHRVQSALTHYLEHRDQPF